MDDNEEYDTNLEDQKKIERNRIFKSTFGVVKLAGKMSVNFFCRSKRLNESNLQN